MICAKETNEDYALNVINRDFRELGAVVATAVDCASWPKKHPRGKEAKERGPLGSGMKSLQNIMITVAWLHVSTLSLHHQRRITVRTRWMMLYPEDHAGSIDSPLLATIPQVG